MLYCYTYNYFVFNVVNTMYIFNLHLCPLFIAVLIKVLNMFLLSLANLKHDIVMQMHNLHMFVQQPKTYCHKKTCTNIKLIKQISFII